jgi:hypothetical protein
MKLTIYEVTVPMKDQSQCNRMKQLCIDNGLPIPEGVKSFKFTKENLEKNCFRFSKLLRFFSIWYLQQENVIVTESEFIELLKQEKA